MKKLTNPPIPAPIKQNVINSPVGSVGPGGETNQPKYRPMAPINRPKRIPNAILIVMATAESKTGFLLCIFSLNPPMGGVKAGQIGMREPTREKAWAPLGPM